MRILHSEEQRDFGSIVGVKESYEFVARKWSYSSIYSYSPTSLSSAVGCGDRSGYGC